MDDIYKYKSHISKRLQYHLSRNKVRDKESILANIIKYSMRGKMIRGCLTLLGCEMFGGKITKDKYDIACAVELFHSGLLMHDDIIDRDDLRRGALSMHRLYEKDVPYLSISQQNHYGISQALCTGDIAFFWGMEILASADLDFSLQKIVLIKWAQEFMSVGESEMKEQRLSISQDKIKIKNILWVYAHKTGHYTFSLPLVTGAIIAKTSQEVCNNLFKLGKALGILFQIKDDELSMFGDSDRTGKPVGGDVREGKKTLYYYYLSRLLPEQKKKEVLSMFGSISISLQDIVVIRQIIKTYGVDKAVQKEMYKQVLAARRLIKRLPLNVDYQSVLQLLVDFSLERSA